MTMALSRLRIARSSPKPGDRRDVGDAHSETSPIRERRADRQERHVLTEAAAQRIVEIRQAKLRDSPSCQGQAYASREVVYLNADDEDQAPIAQALLC